MYTTYSFLVLRAPGNKWPSLHKTGTPLKFCAACHYARGWCAFSNVVLCPEGNHSNLQDTGLSVTNSSSRNEFSVDKFLWWRYSLLSALTKLEAALRKIMSWIPSFMTVTPFVNIQSLLLETSWNLYVYIWLHMHTYTTMHHFVSIPNRG